MLDVYISTLFLEANPYVAHVEFLSIGQLLVFEVVICKII